MWLASPLAALAGAPHYATTFAFTLLAATNRICRIESSVNFSNWTERLRLTNPPPAGTVTMPIAPGEPRQFFRAITS